MALTLKTRIALGGIFLFVLLSLVAAVSVFYFNRQIYQSKDVLKDNYESVEYARSMLMALNNWPVDSSAAGKVFEQNLRNQEANITEPGENALTAEVRSMYLTLKAHPDSSKNIEALREDLNKIIGLNLEGMNRKNAAYQQAAENAKTMITIIIAFCLLVGFTFVYNFPGLIAGPIAKLTEGIKGIANKDYGQRIHLNRKDEWGEMADAFNNMAEKLDNYEHSNLARIMFEKQRAETVINSLKDASIGIDNTGKILFANQQALQLLNLRESDLVGRPQEEVSSGNDLFRFLIGNNHHMPFKVVLNDKENYFTKEIIAIKQGEEKLGNVIILENITPFKEMDVAKTNFIATISHELKTPLASSDFSLKLLEDERVGKLSNEQKELVQSLRNDNQRLLRILSELLDLSQVESGKIQLNLQSISPLDIISKAELTVANAAKEKNITINRQVSNNLPVMQADPEKALWVINNFLTNAIRYSPENGNIVIKANKINEEFVEIGVQDFGIGIDSPFQHKIFDRFFRVPGIKEKKGTGLGLAISKDMVEGMNGEIGLKSELGKGSYFFSRFRIA